MSRRPALAIAALFAALLIAGCEDVVNIEVPDGEPELAVYGFANPDSTWFVHVYRTAGLDERVGIDDVAIDDAVVVISDSSGTDTLWHAGAGRYVNWGSSPIPGSTYRLDVSAPGYSSVFAVDAVPHSPGFQVRSKRGEEGPFSVEYQLTMTLDDPDGPNWYRLALYQRTRGGAGSEEWMQGFFSSGEPFFRTSAATVGSVDIELTAKEYDEVYFDDATFNGESIDLVLTTDLRPPVGEVYVQLTAMSEAYFQYHRTLALQQRNEGDPLSDPVGIRSNVNGGVGVFGAYVNTTRMVWLN